MNDDKNGKVSLTPADAAAFRAAADAAEASAESLRAIARTVSDAEMTALRSVASNGISSEIEAASRAARAAVPMELQRLREAAKALVPAHFSFPIEGFASAAKAAMQSLVSFKPVIDAAADELRRQIASFSKITDATDAFLKDWDARAPQAVKNAIATRGLIVPLSQLALSDLPDLLRTFDEKGDDAVAEWLAQQYDEIFGDPGFLNRLVERWASRSKMKRRMPLLRQGIRAHELGLFAASIPTLLTQFEGLVADLVNHQGYMNFGDLKTHVTNLASNAPGDELLPLFVGDALLAKFGHGSLIPPFSRHAILHGGDVDYATETNSRTAILLVDQLTEFTDIDQTN